MYHHRTVDPNDPRSDEELAAAALRHGSSDEGREALETLLQRYTRPVYLHCKRVLIARDDALDAAQDVLVRIMERLEKYDPGRAQFAAWVFAVTRNHCLNVLRAGRVRARDEAVDPDDVIARVASIETVVEQEDEKARLLDFVERVLDPLESRALWMRCVEEVPVDEIARLLGIDGQSGARGVLQRARRKLRAARERGEL